MLTYRSFATPFDLLEGLSQRLKTSNESDKKAVSLRVFNVFKHWFEKAWYDFEKDCPDLYLKTTIFLDECIQDFNLKVVANNIKGILERKMNGEDKIKSKVNIKAPRPILPKDPTCDILDISSEEIARQLTIVEWETWKSIQPWECLSLAWMKKDKETQAPNVIKMIERFNWVSSWVASCICTIENTKKRSKTINKFIEIAERCFSLQNFNAVMEIVSGLNRGPVYRLKQSWENVTGQMKRTFDELKAITDRSKNYANMRKHLKKVDPPLLPYLGIYLTDLTFIEEGNKNFIGELINFKKRHLISETIRSIKQYQQKAYSLERVDFIIDKLKNITLYNEDVLYELSEYLEPRLGKERGARPSILDGQKHKQEIINIELEDIDGQPYARPNLPEFVILDDNKVKHGTLDKIVEYLTHHAIIDSEGLPSFLHTFRIYTTPSAVLDEFIRRFNIPPPKDKSPQSMETYKTEMVNNIQLRVFFALKTWIEKSYYDFSYDYCLKEKILDFIQGDMTNHTPKYAKVLIEAINKQGSNIIPSVSDEKPPPIIFSNYGINISTASILDFDSEELSRQLCIYVQSLFLSIQPHEYLDMHYKTSENPNRQAQNLQAFLDLASPFHSWIENEAGNNDKISVIVKFTEIASWSTRHQNLATAFIIVKAIMQRMNDASFGLSMEELPNGTRSMLEAEYENYTTYGSLRTLMENLSPPCIPVVSYFIDKIKDIDKTCGVDVLPDGKINFEKTRKYGVIIAGLSEVQKRKYNFEDIPTLQHFINNKLKASNDENETETQDGGNSIHHMFLDLIHNNEAFKKEVKDIVLDFFAIESNKLRKEFSDVVKGIRPKTSLISEETINLLPRKSTNSPSTSPLKTSNETNIPCGVKKAPPSNVKAVTPSYGKYRASFTSASKQPGMRNLLLSLGKSSGDLSPLKKSFNPSNTDSVDQDTHNTTEKLEVKEVPVDILKSPVEKPQTTPPLPQPKFPVKPSGKSSPVVKKTPGKFVVPPGKKGVLSSTKKSAPLKQILNVEPNPKKMVPVAKVEPNVKKMALMSKIPLKKVATVPSNTSSLKKVAKLPSTPKKVPPTSLNLTNVTPEIKTKPTHTIVSPRIESGRPDFTKKSMDLLLKEFSSADLETWEYYDERGTVFGKPITVSAQILNRERVHICCIQETVGVKEVAELVAIGTLYKSVYKDKLLSCVIISENISNEAFETAKKYKIKTFKV